MRNHSKNRKNTIKLIVLGIISVGLIAFYLLYGINFQIIHYQLPSRILRTGSIIVVALSIGISTVIFQTIVKNRILTPSIMGLDSVYVFIQTTIIFIAGVSSPLLLNSTYNYFLSMGGLVLFTVVVFKYLFKLTKNNVFILLLIGIILGTFFQNLSTFMQVLVSPEDFMILQNNLFGSFSSTNETLLLITSVLVFIMIIVLLMDFHSLDVMALGRDHAINLGVNYDRKVSFLLIIVAILVSASTALVGPIMFLGLLVVNLSHEIFKTYKHFYIIIGTALISVIALLIGQMVVQFIFKNNIELSVIINLIGGVYFIYLMLRRSRA
ncbi:iron chelate uptake ABC transporter family permease subunit [Phocicoccus pinnipedialis]|uniref:Hemin transport system permease protein HmuU n=1 Tax=Phocicoccus pinnipedialis TaxID=110845 RepID=A0A6V7R072_9BACL|nr:iron chelate uptake ABC transporter family permease subunit [Jeotgalicoccus pinnipedialis]MBP1938767.1 iron complex transport system permease protein [Jeotgalicoccus pinnipedialis]CAD2070719.1 Hemin transport system permease protein HmuU [Jeotgalicoccus pinnipedialis]